MPKTIQKNLKKRVPHKYHALAGSERPPKPATRQLKEASAAEIVTVRLTVRRRPGGPPLRDLNYFQKVPLRSRKLLSRQEFEAAHGAAQEDLDAVGKFCQSHDLTVVESNRSRRRVVARGTVAQVNSAFAVKLHYYQSAHGKYRGFDGPVGVPVALKGIVEAVIGLDNRPVPIRRLGGADPGTTGALTPGKVAQLYNFPPGTGAGQTIGTWQDQGYGFKPSDVTTTLQNWGVSPLPPAPTAFPPGSNSEISDVETIIDLTIASAIAPKASIVAYICQGPATSDIIDTLQNMIHPAAGDPVPGILFICYVWSADDDTNSISAQEYTQIDTLFQEAANLGITVLTGSGDTGAQVDPTSTVAQTIYPASDPYLLTCGGTTIGNITAAGFAEYVWNDTWTNPSNGQTYNGATGGGVSALFPVPPYQADIVNLPKQITTGNPGRGVPDVAGNASQNSGYYMTVSPEMGTPYNLLEGGTSAVAPLYAGLIARINETLGANVGFLNPTLYALCTVGTSVCRTVPSPVGQGPTNNDFNGVTGYPAGVGLGWNACTGFGSLDGTKLLNGIKAALPNPQYYFQVNKGSYGQNEVIQNMLYSNPVPMWLVVDGFSPNQVANTILAQGLPSIQAALPHVSIVVGSAVPENPNAMDTAQRVFFPCTVSFIGTSVYNSVSQGGIFPDPGTATPTQCLLIASSFTVNGQALPPAETILMMDPGAAPYFGNFANNGDFFLSQDLRVFTVTPGQNATPIMGIKLQAANDYSWDTKQAYTYIQNLLKKLNNSSYNDPSGGDVFSTFPDQNNALGADSTVTPFTYNSGDPSKPFVNYAFAVARVRIDGFSNQSTVANVRVLFRLFAAQTSDTDFQPNTYPSTLDSAGQPLAPQLGVDQVTIPFFATGNYESNSDYQVNNDYSETSTSVNNQPVNLGSSGNRYAYYGCYLNVNPLGNTIKIGSTETPVSNLLPATHCCLVAQLVYDDAPMPTAADEPQGPEYTNNFAQRNLQVTVADNPGPPAAQRVPQTFDARPSPAPGTGPLENYPDELMIAWGDTPAGSIANIYWPAIASSDVLALAQKFYSTHQLTTADAHTIQCIVQPGYTFVPIPTGAGENFAGLFSVNLVEWVTVGQTFTITVRRISTRRAATPPSQPPPPPQPRIEAVTAETLVQTPEESMRNWRYVVGTFAVRIPVVKAEVMLPLDENTLAIMKWRLSQMAPTNRWVPVLQRYIGVTEGRIFGLGGNPERIKPSPWGTYGPPLLDGDRLGHGVAKCHEVTGKVNGVVYDRFGDFEGFRLLTEEGHERCFASREAEIEALARYAWVERIVITVVSEAHEPERPVRIILRRAPPQPHHAWP